MTTEPDDLIDQEARCQGCEDAPTVYSDHSTHPSTHQEAT